ncbi:DUF805 domain-containing protein [Asticcacaulis sp. AC460]|uniref:DUF805 domain-containing protein n=1 Tax=Asticcacaulis sp. AC460 TaxID=1282360 RepID=UPI00138AFEF4|nr:DUF805 domain-containing protein [Asticcacaulis sp. AC460]
MFKPFMKYADFRGRARRSEYWLFQLFQFLVAFVLIAIMMISVVGSIADRNAGAAVGGSAALMGFIMVFALACLLPNLAVTVRRLHDTNKSAWWLLLYAPGVFANVTNMQMFAAIASGNPDNIMAASTQSSILSLVGFLGNIVMFVLMVLPGTPGPNRFGDDPKGGVADIARVFDAPEPEDSRPAYAEPHKPVFDFGPSRGVPMVREAAPAPAPQPRYTPASAGNPLAPGAVRPTFGKRR